MAKDIKSNYLQHTEAHLETRCSRLEKWLASESHSEYMGDGREVGGTGTSGEGMEVEAEAKKKRGKSKKGGGIPEELGEVDEDWRRFAAQNLKVKSSAKVR